MTYRQIVDTAALETAIAQLQTKLNIPKKLTIATMISYPAYLQIVKLGTITTTTKMKLEKGLRDNGIDIDFIIKN